MPRYRYLGTDFAGREVTGERDAADPDALLAALAGELAKVDSVQSVGGDLIGDPLESLHHDDMTSISGHIAELIESEFPLESGLAAIAAECSSRRLRNALHGIAHDLSAGNNLESVLAARGAPPELKALVRAGARSGDTGQILEHYVINAESAVDLRQSLRRGLLYPVVLLVFFAGVAGAVMLWVVPQFVTLFDGFDIKLPLLTQWLVTFSAFCADYALATSLVVIASVATVVILLRLALGKVLWRRFVCRIPLLGPALRWTALARFSQLLSLLVENRVPLDEAVVLAGDASHDAEIQHDCRTLLAGVRSGETLESAARKLNRFPTSFVHALGWAGRPGGLPEVLQSLGDMYAGRVRAAVAVLVAIVPPLLMLFLGISLAFLVIALFLPLFNLLNSLA